jgi:hypothetical protein
MPLTNQVLSGALIGALVRRPVPAFALGVASHCLPGGDPPYPPLRYAPRCGAGRTTSHSPGRRPARFAGLVRSAVRNYCLDN